VIDDGSVDGTDGVVGRWQRNVDFTIRYFFQSQSGLEVAWNNGVAKAGGYFVAIIGSDDHYLPTGLEALVSEWVRLDRPEEYANVEGLALTTDGTVIGDRFPQDAIDSDNLAVRWLLGVRGDKVGMYRRDVLRDYPFDERWARNGVEATVWNRIAQEYRSRFINVPIAIVEYQGSGLAARPSTERIADPVPWKVHWDEFLATKHELPWRVVFYASANAARFGFRLHRWRCPCPWAPRRSRSALILGIAAGAAWALRDKWRLFKHPQGARAPG
jgi:glycosyltransferase involved in cell wall biosynthesis